MPLIEHIMDSDLERLALDQVVPALLDQGFFYVDSFLGDLVGDIVLDQVREMHRSGMLQDGRLAATGRVSRTDIRGDKTAWVSGPESGCEAINFLLTLIDKLVSLCICRLGKSVIRERSKAMVACYPGNGTGYVKHVDNPNGDGRCVTCIYYLNKNWNAT
ncbi:prolyl hydroxylase EGLN3-like, partial [Polymixia lowei]